MIFRAKNDNFIGSSKTDGLHRTAERIATQAASSSFIRTYSFLQSITVFLLELQHEEEIYCSSAMFTSSTTVDSRFVGAAGSENLELKEAHPKLKVQWNRVLLGSCFCEPVIYSAVVLIAV